MNFSSDETEDDATEDAVYECALAELLAERVATDVRPLLQKFQKAPAAVAEAFALLPPSMQEELGGMMLPAGDAARGDGLRNAHLSETIREFKESLDEVPTPAALQRRRDRARVPAVGDRCEGRFRAGVDGLSLRKAWFPGVIVGEGAAGAFCVRYDDGDEEDGVRAARGRGRL